MVVVSAVFVTLSVGCGRSGPEKAAITSYISSDALPADLAIKDLEFADFPSSAQEGRVSCRGTLELTRDRVEEDRDAFLDDVQRALGTPYHDAGGWFFELFPNAHFYKVVSRKGMSVPFRAELLYYRQVDGWRFSGSADYERPEGLSAQELNSYAQNNPYGKYLYVIGSPAYNNVMQKIVAESAKRSLQEKAFVTKISQFFKKGNTLQVGRRMPGSKTAEPYFSLIINGPMNWKPEAIYSKSFEVSADAQWLTKGKYAGLNFQQGQVVNQEQEIPRLCRGTRKV